MKSSSDPVGESGRAAFTRYLLAVALGVAVLVGVAEVLLRTFIVPIDDSRANRVAVVYAADGSDVVLGDSHLYRSFLSSPDFVNLARPGSSPHALEIVAREYFRFREPGRVIVQASPQLFNFLAQTRNAQDHDEFFAQNIGLPFQLYVFEPGIGRQLGRMWELDRVRSDTAKANGRKKLDGVVVAMEAQQRQALSRKERYTLARRRFDSNRPLENVRETDGFAAYRRMVEWLLSRGALVCLARTPIDQALQETIALSKLYKDAHTAMRELAAELGIPYVDFRDLDLDLKVDSFTNPDHLTTAAGARYAGELETACF